MTFDIQSMDQWTNGPMDQWTNRPKDQWTNGPMLQWTNGLMDNKFLRHWNTLEHWIIGTLEHSTLNQHQFASCDIKCIDTV